MTCSLYKSDVKLDEQSTIRNSMFPIFIILLFVFLGFGPVAGGNYHVTVETSPVIITNIPTQLNFQLQDGDGNRILDKLSIPVSGLTVVSGKMDSLRFVSGDCIVKDAVFAENKVIKTYSDSGVNEHKIRVIPGWLTILPPLIAIILALIARQVLVALFVGVWIGSAIIYNYNPFSGFLNALTEYIGKAPADPDKMSIIIFSLTLGGMVGVISKMGGTQGIVEKLAQYASDRRRGQFVTWLMGVFIFFDDYANTLIVGSTMRPLTDRLRISREKLSYLVDSTAAPVANIAIISTWIGFEIGLIGVSFNNLGISDNAYLTFFRTIPYNFYPLFALILGLSIALMGRDFGAMRKAEQRARDTGEVLGKDANPLSSMDSEEIIAPEHVDKRWYNGFVPIAVVIVTTLAGLWFTGLAAVQTSSIKMTEMGFIRYVSTVVGASDSYSVLMWAAFVGSITAIVLAVFQKLLTLEDSVRAWVGGTKAMLLAALILTMAWSIGNICNDLHTADYIIHISEGLLSAHLIPVLSFLIAALISFATGTSWGVMAILMPIVIPMAYILPQSDAAISEVNRQAIFLSTIASVLAGATFGDHCSPISDTTIMSSMASGADHVDHVRTQLPYALFGGVLSIIVGYIPVGFGVSPYIVLPVGIILILLFVRFFGQKI
jgi:Na+/H+ antiporter NhaC